MQTSKKPYPGTQAVLRAMQLLKVFTDLEPERSLNEICENTGLNRTTTYRLLSALESEGFVTHDPIRDHYRLGSELIVMGSRAVRSNPLRTVAHPALVHLAQKTGEMASLELLEGDKTIILDEVKGHKQKRLNTSIGNLWPAHATSTGKILLAQLSPRERLGRLLFPLTAVTPHTITEQAQLEAALQEAQQNGYAQAVDELEVGLTEVAAPVLNHRQEAVAAVSVGGPTVRLPRAKLLGLVGMVQETAHHISLQLGYRP